MFIEILTLHQTHLILVCSKVDIWATSSDKQERDGIGQVLGEM